MNLLGALAAALVAAQGQAVQLEYAEEAGLASVHIVWNKRQIPFAQSQDGWFTVVGVDLNTAAGDYPAAVTFTYADGHTRTLTETVTVKSRDFPTTRLDVAPEYVDLSEADGARAAREADEIAAIYAMVTPAAYWTQPFRVPIPGVAGGRNFGHRRIFNDQPRAPHSGADLTAATGTEIQASNRGRVVLAKNLFFSGNAVFIDHGLGVYSAYLHLSEIGVASGDMVEQGQVIGLAGATGRVTGPHLHWGVRITDARVDPFSLPGLGGSVVGAE